eukprot:m.234060 g.234060  ORF g.234060 m.234060 type:complete len:757 (+) comp12606_c0_seq1:18-2288(+)
MGEPLPCLRELDGIQNGPDFRNVLEAHDESVSRLIDFTKDLEAEIAAYAKASQGASARQQKIADLLCGFKFQHAVNETLTTEDFMIDESLRKFGETLRKQEQQREALMTHIAIIAAELRAVRKDVLGQLKEHTVSHRKQSEAFQGAEEKYLGFSGERSDTALKDADDKMLAEKEAHQRDTVQYINMLRNRPAQSRILIVTQMLRYMEASAAHARTSVQAVEEIRDTLASLPRCVSSQKLALDVRDEQESRLVSEYFSPSQVRPVNVGVKTGYLYLCKTNLLRIPQWTRMFFAYTRATRTLRAVKVKGSTELEVHVDRCAQPTTVVERRFCFEVLTGDKAVLLQARSDEDRRAWMAAMGGVQPVKSVRKKRGGIEDFSVGKGITPQKVSLLQKLMLWLERHFVDVEGIYRVSGQKSKIEKLVNGVLIANQTVDLAVEECATITSAIKAILYELPEPIFTYGMYDSLVSVISLPTKQAQCNKLIEVLYDLPSVNFDVLKMLFRHLQKVLARCDVNKMTINNLGVVFGPTLMRGRGDSLSALADLRACSYVVEVCIDSFSELFEEEKDVPPTPGDEDILSPPASALHTPPVTVAADPLYAPVIIGAPSSAPAAAPVAAAPPQPAPRVPPRPDAGSAARMLPSRPAPQIPSLPAAASQAQIPAVPGPVAAVAALASSELRCSPRRTPQRAPKRPRVLMRALFDCGADDESELAFAKGDVIECLDDPADDPGWRWGLHTVTRKKGLFPENYCEIVPADTQA